MSCPDGIHTHARVRCRIEGCGAWVLKEPGAPAICRTCVQEKAWLQGQARKAEREATRRSKRGPK